MFQTVEDMVAAGFSEEFAREEIEGRAKRAADQDRMRRIAAGEKVPALENKAIFWIKDSARDRRFGRPVPFNRTAQ